ncbi:MAG TPA: hypothetical protein VHG93_18120 [Longimicrobium sp.]|nr:hypothetical protein [Longimicrobium sp.]
MRRRLSAPQAIIYTGLRWMDVGSTIQCGGRPGERIEVRGVGYGGFASREQEGG